MSIARTNVTTRAQRARGEGGRVKVSFIAVALLVAVLPFVASGPADAVLGDDHFEIDRNAFDAAATAGDDWSNVCETTDEVPGSGSCTGDHGGTVAEFVVDQPGTSIFTQGGSKDDLDITGWRHTNGSVPDKDELTHGMVARYDDLLYFGANRLASNGDAQIGIWFLQRQVAPLAGGTFSGSHRDGDVLVLSNFTNGGGQPNIRVFEWNGPSGDLPGSGSINGTLDLLAGSVEEPADCLIALTANACATVNETQQPSPWPFKAKGAKTPDNAFPAGHLYEGAMDLGSLGLADECFSSFVIETRSSASVDAVLKDFVAGDFEVCGATLRTTPSSSSVAIGQSVTDGATITVTGGSNPPAPTGTVSFSLCGPITAPALCTTGGTAVGTVDLSSATVNGTSYSVTSPSVTPTSAGRYCFRADWAGDTNYPDGGTDSLVTECFTVTPKQPTISTVATAGPVALGTAVKDTATLSGTSVTPGGAAAGGTITFRAYGPFNDTTTCTGDPVHTSVVNVSGDGNYDSTTFTPTAPGTYNWIATYSGDSPNTLGVAGSCGDANESSVIQQLQPTIATAQSFIPNDSATVSVGSGAGNLAGSVRFRLYENSTCAGTAVYDQTVAVSGASPQTVSTTNTGDTNAGGYKVTSTKTLSWLVEYSSTNLGHTGVTSACNVENSSLTITNG